MTTILQALSPAQQDMNTLLLFVITLLVVARTVDKFTRGRNDNDKND